MELGDSKSRDVDQLTWLDHYLEFSLGRPAHHSHDFYPTDDGVGIATDLRAFCLGRFPLGANTKSSHGMTSFHGFTFPAFNHGLRGWHG